MIDEDFDLDRIKMRALGQLLIAAQNHPLLPGIREVELYRRVYEQEVSSERRGWLDNLVEHNLIRVAQNQFRAGDRLGEPAIDVCITPAGVYYTASRADVFAMSARTPTDDFPDEVVDAPWAIQSYYSPSSTETAPTADSFVRFDHNQAAYDDVISKIDDVYEALKSDNELGAKHPLVRDEKLEELIKIKEILEKKEGWQTHLIAAGWGVFGYLATSFADRPVGALAEQAWQALQVVIGIR